MTSPIRQVVKALMTAVLPRTRFLVRGPARARDVCLTFDDGPHPQHTPRLLDVLKAEGVRGTFFMIGREIEKHPDIVRRAADEGHTVGGHSFTHGDPGRTSAGELADEAERTERLLHDVVGRPSRLFRPPHGKLTAGKFWRLWRADQRIVLWNVDPKDFDCKSPDELAERLEPGKLQGGDVVLLHDNHPHAAEALPGVIRSARQRGIGFSTVMDWLGDGSRG